MDKKSYSRFQSYKSSLAALSEIRQRDLEDTFVVSGAGAKLGITFDLSWKVMKDIVIQEYGIVDFVKGSPRETLRKAFECNLIADEAWMFMLRDRNDLTHDYDGVIVKDVCVRIITKYLDLMEAFAEQADRYF